MCIFEGNETVSTFYRNECSKQVFCKMDLDCYHLKLIQQLVVNVGRYFDIPSLLQFCYLQQITVHKANNKVVLTNTVF